MKTYYIVDECDICGLESKKNYVDKLKIYNKSTIRDILLWFYKCYIIDHKLYLCKKCVIKFNKAMCNKDVSGDFSPSDTHNRD